jgi:hypothetical protein
VIGSLPELLKQLLIRVDCLLMATAIRGWTTSLVALLALWMIWGTVGASASSTTTPSRCQAGAASAACLHTLAIAHASDSESGEAEEELEEGAEEAATAEVEAEEVEAEGSPTPRSTSANTITLSHLELTSAATVALAHHLPSASSIGFSFTLSTAARVQVTIVRQTSATGGKRWAKLPDSLMLTVAKGRNARSLKGRNRLPAGRYRLTAKPTGGRSRSIYLSVQR